jgi:signal peptidase I
MEVAIRGEQRTLAETKKSPKREYTESIIIAIVLALLIRAVGVQAFKIPSGSMMSTLLIGDHILVNKFLYGVDLPYPYCSYTSGAGIGCGINSWHLNLGLRQINRGDILVFMFPQDEGKDFIKRVIGLPNEQIEIRNKRVYINGELLKEPYVIFEDDNVRPKSDPRDNFGPAIVPPGHLFMMGDNRDNSADSRFWGFLDMKKIKGKAFIIYWSWDSNNTGLRWDRIGRLIE